MSTIRPSVPGDRGDEVGAVSVAGGIAEPCWASPQVRRLVLGELSGVVARCRDFTRQALTDWAWLPVPDAEQRAVVDDVLLVVSEVVSNACLHAGGPQELRLRGDVNLPTLRIEVADGGAEQPRERSPHRSGRPGGHGLFIVERLATDWGMVRHPGEGKTVWVDMARGR